MKYIKVKEVSAHELAAMLFKRHTHISLLDTTHAETFTKQEIVYREIDVIDLLTTLGYPKPDFESFGKAVRMLGKSYPWNAVK